MRLKRKIQRLDATDRGSYSFYVVVKPEGAGFQLESGWDTVEEAKDMVKELPRYLNAKVFSKNQLGRLSLNPSNNNHWMKG